MSVAKVERPYKVSSHMLTSITAKLTNSGLDIKTKNKINEMIVKTNMSIPTKSPLCAPAQSTL